MTAQRRGLLDRCSLILSVIAKASPRPRKLREVAEATGLHRATTHRILAQLQEQEMVERVPAGYTIGPYCWTLGRAAARRYDFRRIARHSVERIAEVTRDVGLLSTRLGAHAETIVRAEGTWPIHPTAMRAGTVRPLGCTAPALAILAALPDDEIGPNLAATREERARDYPIFDDAHLHDLIAETRANGFAYTSGQIIAGTGAFALACCDADGLPVAAISHSAVIERCGLDRADEVVPLIEEERQRIERQIRGLIGPEDDSSGRGRKTRGDYDDPLGADSLV